MADDRQIVDIKKASGNEIVLDAFESFAIRDKNSGKIISSCTFNPSDVDLPRRMRKLMDWLNTVKIPEGDNVLDEMYAVTDELKRRVNEALASDDAADALFYANPFSPTKDGQLVAEQVLNAVAKVIEERTGERIKKVNRRLKTYTSKYHK